MVYSFLITCFSAVFYITPVLVFLSSKMTVWKKLGLLVLAVFSQYVLSSFLSNIGVAVYLLILGIYLFFIDKHHLRNECLLILAYLLDVIIDNAVSTTCTLLTGITVPEIASSPVRTMFFVLGCIVISFAVSKLLVYFWRKFNLKSNITELPGKTMLFIFLNLFLTLCLFIVNIVFGQMIGYSPEVISFNTFIFTVYFIGLLWTTIRAIRVYQREMELKIEKDAELARQKYTEQVESLYNDIRSFKHDYVNVLLTMHSYIEEKDVEGLSRYFYQKILPQKEQLVSPHAQLSCLSHLKIPELKSLLIMKLLLVQEKHIDLSVEIAQDIEKIGVDILDLSKIFGVFLDNAIEAAQETKEPKLDVALLDNDTETVFIISNTFIDRQIPLCQLSQPDVSTKGEGRGLGLYNVKLLIEKYPALFLDTQMEDEWFTQSLHIVK